MDTHTHTHTHTHTQHTHMQVRTREHTHVRTHARMREPERTYARTPARVLTHAHTHTHTHTHTRAEVEIKYRHMPLSVPFSRVPFPVFRLTSTRPALPALQPSARRPQSCRQLATHKLACLSCGVTPSEGGGRAFRNHSNIVPVSRASLWRFLKDRVEYLWSFHNATKPS